MKRQDVSLEVTWDEEADAGYLYLQDKDSDSCRTEFVEGTDVNVDIDEDGNIIGFEFYSRANLPEKLENLVDGISTPICGYEGCSKDAVTSDGRLGMVLYACRDHKDEMKKTVAQALTDKGEQYEQE